jgi:exonuclease SbcD
MSRINLLHFADIHIGIENYGRPDPATGVNERVLDFLYRFDEVIDYGLSHDVDVVVFAGDAYKRSKPNPTFQRAFARRVKRLTDADVDVVLLTGNHDIPTVPQRASSIDIFDTLDVPKVIVGHNELVHKIETRHGPVQIATLPYPARQRLLAHDDCRGLSVTALDDKLRHIINNRLQTLAGKIDQSVPAILTAHLTVSEATRGSEQSMMLGRDIDIPRAALSSAAWDYIALGHVHSHQSLNEGSYPHIVYAGSTSRMDFSEEGQSKGFCWVEVARGETTWDFVPLEARSFITVRADLRDELSPQLALQAVIARHNLTDAVVRLIIKLRPEQEPLLREKDIRNLLSDAYFVSSISREVEHRTELHLEDFAPEEMADAELVIHYFREKGVVDKQHLKELQSYLDEIIASRTDE